MDRARRLTVGPSGLRTEKVEYYRTEKQVGDRIAVIASKRRVTAYLKATVGADPATSRPTLERHLDRSALDAEAAADGWYALLTNLGPDVDTAGAFHHPRPAPLQARILDLLRVDPRQPG